MAKKKSKTSPLSRLDFTAALGSDGGVSTECLMIYVPDKDKNGVETGSQRRWVLEAIQLLGEIHGGATAMPPVEGVWVNDKGEFIRESPQLVYAYVKPDAFIQNLWRLREFLHRMGRETNQGEIAFEFNDLFYRIRTFDSV